MNRAESVLIQAGDACATLMEQAAEMLVQGVDPSMVAAELRLAASAFRAVVRPPMVEAEVRHAAAMLRVADPRAVIGGLGPDMAGP